MAQKSFVIQNFYGGIAQNQKAGQPHSFRFGRNLELFEDTNYVTLKPKPAKVSGSTVTQLIHWIVDESPWASGRWFLGTDELYYENSSGTWSDFGQVISSNGHGLCVYNNTLYATSAHDIWLWRRLSAGVTYLGLNLMSAVDSTGHLDQTGGGTGNTYTTPTAINEGATHRQTFTPTINPLAQIKLNIVSKGTGDWTVTVHDASNNLIKATTYTNAQLSNGSFTFSLLLPAPNIVPNNSYHFHVISTVADGTVNTNVASDLEGASFSTYFFTLVYDANWHPMMEFLNMLVIGNGNYLATWDDAVYSPNRITLAPGFNVRALAKVDEYIVAACWKGSSIDDVEEGRLYFWDGVSTTFNFFKQVDIGSPNAIANSKNRIFGVYGSSGDMYVGVEPFQKVHEAPQLARGKKIEVYPGAVTDWQGDTLIGIAGSTDDATGLEQGVYEWGNGFDSVPEALNYAYKVSTGTTQGTTLKIGSVKAIGKDLYIGWQDGGSYGVDRVSKTSNPATSGSYESLIFDDGAPQKTKLALKLVVTCQPLVSGETVTPKYKIDRATSWTTGTATSTVGAVRAEFVIDKRFREIEIGFDLVSSTTFPVITSIYLQYDGLEREVEES